MALSLIADDLATFATTDRDAAVTLSQSLVTLLSEQLYKSPIKAVEELVVNSYDADATECRLAIEAPSNLVELKSSFVAVFDNGKGMDGDGLVNLWCIGHSQKRDVDYARRFSRTQIGKFGIGKLASYSVAARLTYLTKVSGSVRGVTMDFGLFSNSDPASTSNIELPIQRITNWAGLQATDRFQEITKALGVTDAQLRA